MPGGWLGKVGLVALDGTKVGCPAALAANRTAEQIDTALAGLDAQLGLVVEDMFTEPVSTDAAEDAALGVEVRGDETPVALRGKNARRARLSAAKAKLAAAEAARKAEPQAHLAERAAKEAEAGKKLRGRKPRRPSRSRRRKRTPPTRRAGSSRASTGSCRATTPRRWSARTRWSSPPR